MKQSDLCTILCHLTCRYYDFPTEQNSLVYEFSGRKYEIIFKRIKGQFKSFTVEDAGEATPCEKLD